MRKLMLCIAVAGFIAGPIVASAQGRPGGVGPTSGSMGSPVGGGQIGGSMGGSMGGIARGDIGTLGSDAGRATAATQRAALRGETERTRRSATTPEQAVFGASTAERAKLLKDADVETRTAFGAYQASLAKAKAGTNAATTVGVESMTDAELSAFAADTQARAKDLKGADRATRKAFGTFQSALAREQALLRAAGSTSAEASFGTQTAARAKLQGEADVDTRKTFGADQSVDAKVKSGADADDSDGND